MVNWDINAGTIVPIVVGFIGTLWRLHTWDVKTSVRHAENTSRFASLEESHKATDKKVEAIGETQKECHRNITETREMVIRLDEANKQRSQ